MQYKIFLDVDGILCDLMAGLNKFFGTNFPIEQFTTWEVAKHWNMSNTRFWKSLDDEFWATLSKTPECDDIINFLLSFSEFDICLLTSPPSHKGIDGKQQWIKKNLPYFFNEKRYLIGPAKKYCAGYNSILIDDHEENIISFRAYGGKVILYPRPWNSFRSVENPFVFMKEKITRIVEMDNWYKENPDSQIDISIPDINYRKIIGEGIET